MHLATRGQPILDPRFRARKLAEPFQAVNPTEPAATRSPEWKVGYRVVDQMVVDQRRTYNQPVGDAPRSSAVTTPHAGVEPVGAVVGEPDRLLFVRHTHDREDRAERLLAHELHAVIDVHEHRGLEEVARPGDRPPPQQHPRPFGLRVLQMRFHLVELERGDQRTDHRLGFVAGADPARLGHDRSHKVVIDRLDHVSALDRHAHLPTTIERCPHRPARRPLDIRIGADDHRVLAAQLQHHGRQALRGRRHDLAAGRRRTGEGDLVDSRFDQRRPRPAIAARHADQTVDADHLSDERGHPLAGEVRVLRRLQHHRIPSGERRPDCRHADREGVIPRGYHTDHAVRLVGHPGTAVQQPSRGGPPPQKKARGRPLQIGEIVAGNGDLGQRLTVHFARLAADDLGDLIGAADQRAPEAVERAGPLRERTPDPRRLRLSRRGDQRPHRVPAHNRDIGKLGAGKRIPTHQTILPTLNLRFHRHAPLVALERKHAPRSPAPNRRRV